MARNGVIRNGAEMQKWGEMGSEMGSKEMGSKKWGQPPFT